MHLKNHNKAYITPRVKRLAQSSVGQPGPVREMPMSTYDLSLLYSRSWLNHPVVIICIAR